MVALRDDNEIQRSTPIPQDTNSIFSVSLQVLRRRVSLFVWQGFFEPLAPVSFENGVLVLCAPSSFHRDWVNDHYRPELVEAVSSVASYPVDVQIIFDSQKAAAPTKSLPVPSDLRPPPALERAADRAQMPGFDLFSSVLQDPRAPIVPLRAPRTSESDDTEHYIETSSLNPNYNFDTFVPGPSNQMGFAACNAVAEQPGNQYSPLFLFGAVGLGKTHLLHAIGLAALVANPKFRVVYMSAEQWVNAYIQAIRERKFEAFRKRFRSCDILLIDDIQFLAGKDASQDEFFHTFNSLHQAHKQIVVTSDKYPHEIEGLEERLQTRLSWGLVADIRPPEMETRIAILYKKAETCGINLPSDVAHYLATQVTSSVRELEGALVRLSAFAKVTREEISIAQAREYLSPVFRRGQSQLTFERICEHVAGYYDLRPADLKGKSRQRQVALARQVAMALCRTHLSMSLPEIGRLFGGRDHTTVLSSVRKVDDLRGSDIGVQALINKIEKGLL